MGRLSLQMLGHHGRDSQTAVASGQSAADRLHGNGVKLVAARIGIGVLVGSGNRGERLFRLLQPVRKQDGFKLARRLLNLGRVSESVFFNSQLLCRLRAANIGEADCWQ